jgi:hypothetical protein
MGYINKRLEVKVNMDENKKAIIVQELTLLLIYLTGWEETGSRRPGGMKIDGPGKERFRAWKGYRFEDIEELQNQDLIYQVPGGKSLFLYKKGKEKALELLKKYIG